MIKLVPPVIQQLLTLTKHDQKVFDKFACNFWEDHAIFKYNSLLITYYFKIQSPNQYDNLRKNYRIPDDVTVFCDSGAYGAITHNKKLDPHDVFDWQRRNGDIAFILDEIPQQVDIASTVGKTNIKHFGFKEFKKCADKTYQNCEIFFNMRGNNRKPLIYGITHGLPVRNLLTNEQEDMYDYWFDKLKDFDFDGWGTGFKPVSNPLLQALAIMKLYDKGIRENIHLLGVAAARTIPVMVWASKYVENMTFDGTRYGHGATTRMYFYPERISKLKFWGEKIFKDPRRGIHDDYSKGALICQCDVCRTILNSFGDLNFYGKSGSFSGALLALHNLLVHTNLISEYEKRLNNKESFLQLAEQHMRRAAYLQVVQAIEFIEDCVTDGFNKTYNKYLAAGFDFGIRKGKMREGMA